MTTHVAADLAVTLAENRPGALARAISTIAAAGINIDGYAEMNGVVHVLTTDLAAARRCLAQAGFREVQEQDVVVVRVENEPGAAARRVPAHRRCPHRRALQLLATGNRLVIASATRRGPRRARQQ